MAAVREHGEPRVGDPDRLAGVDGRSVSALLGWVDKQMGRQTGPVLAVRDHDRGF